MEKIKVMISEKMIKEMEGQDRRFNYTKAEIYRTLGLFWNSQNLPQAAYIWWMRNAKSCQMIKDEGSTRAALRNAYEALQKIKDGNVVEDISGETQAILAGLDDKYELEKDRVKELFREVLGKKLPTVGRSSV